MKQYFMQKEKEGEGHMRANAWRGKESGGVRPWRGIEKGGERHPK